MSDEIYNEMDMLSEAIALLDALHKTFHGISLTPRKRKYKGCVIEVSFKLLKRGK